MNWRIRVVHTTGYRYESPVTQSRLRVSSGVGAKHMTRVELSLDACPAVVGAGRRLPSRAVTRPGARN